jgi:cytochrome b561
MVTEGVGAPRFFRGAPSCSRRPPEAKPGNKEKVHSMLYTIAVVMIILWLLGLVTSTTMGGLIHILLVIAIIMILVNLISGRRSL